MKKSTTLYVLAFFCLLVMPHQAFAQRGGRSQGDTIPVRLASPLPEHSDWGRALNRLSADWARITNNKVFLDVRHNSAEGTETQILSSLRADNIQAGLLIAGGLAEVCPMSQNLSVPFQIRNEAELELVLHDVLPTLESHVKSDYVVIAWANGGWVHIFSKDPIIVPDDLRRHKLAASFDAKDMNLAFRTIGFPMVETDIKDIGFKLNSNAINAVYLTPVLVAANMLHKNLPNMLKLPISPILAAIVINRVTWNKFDSDQQRKLVESTRRIALEFDTVTPKLENTAINRMMTDGLKINAPSGAQIELWHNEILKIMPSLIGTIYDRNLYQRISGILEKSRNE
ncbi:MAG: TRAP transporter substrate-binding protein DctP [Treponema sp.]|jgi:TRAP-type C4-dicarboxylate transport system substrate-binding protein|nr:TRAP transporter substrate-binding protein DctP [Treponema sp.]